MAPGAKLSAPDAKKRILALLEDGVTVEDACRAVGKSVKSYEYYRASDPQFKEAVDLLRVIQKRKGVVAVEDVEISFEDFRAKYLTQRPSHTNATSPLC